MLSTQHPLSSSFLPAKGLQACHIRYESLINGFNKKSDGMYQKPSYFDNYIDDGKGMEFHVHIAQDVVFSVWPPPHIGSP